MYMCVYICTELCEIYIILWIMVFKNKSEKHQKRMAKHEL